MNVLIVGCGRVGATLAGILDAEGHGVTTIDIERASFAHLPATYKGATFLGNGSDIDVLRQNAIGKADAFLALTQGDNRNLMAAQIAKEIFGVKRVFAKVNDPIRSEIYTIAYTLSLHDALPICCRGTSRRGRSPADAQRTRAPCR